MTLNYFKAEVAGYLDEILAYAQKSNLPMTKITLILRDPGNDEMVMMLTNESEDELQRLVTLALSKAKV